MGKKRIESPIEGQRMSGVQRPQWERVMAVEAKIKEAKMIRENLAKTIRDRLVRAEADRNLGERIASLQHERNAMLDEIEADRQALARMLITSLAACDFAATMACRFADECKRLSGNEAAGRDYAESVREARHTSAKALEDFAKAERMWEDIVSGIDAPGDDKTSNSYARLAEQFTERAMPLVEGFERGIADSSTDQF